MSEFYVDFRNSIKIWEEGFGFLDNCIWIGCAKFFVKWWEYLSSAVNNIGSVNKQSDVTKRDILQLIWSWNDNTKR